MLNTRETQEMLDQLRDAGVAMSNPHAAISSLLTVRGLIVDHPPSDFASHVDDHTLAALYVLRKIIADIWVNLGTDATIDLTQISNEIASLADRIARFLQIALDQQSMTTNQVWHALSEVIRSYCEAMASVQQRFYQS